MRGSSCVITLATTTGTTTVTGTTSTPNRGRIAIKDSYKVLKRINKYNQFNHLAKRFIGKSVISSINPELSTYLDIQLSSSTLCSTNDNKQFVFVYVFSSIKNFERRQLIRSTWANNKNLRVAFIIGKSYDDPVYEQLALIERNNYDDIIQGNFIDSYRTLSYKSLTAWKWITDNCDLNLIKFIIKIDDDVVLNSKYLDEILNSKKNEYKIQNLKNTFLCNVFSGYSPDKNAGSKYYIKDNEYNADLYGINNYSSYCFGPGFLMSTDLVIKLFSQSMITKLFWLDDAYVGILARYSNATFLDDHTAYYDYDSSKMSLDYNLSTILFIRNVDTNSDFNRIWNML